MPEQPSTKVNNTTSPSTSSLGRIAEDVFYALPHPVLILDGKLTIAYQNHAAVSFFSSGECFVEAMRNRAQRSAELDWHNELRHVLETGETSRKRGITFKCPDGNERRLEMTFTPFAGGIDNATLGIMVAVEDVSERLSLEKQLSASESMAAVGRLAARVAHELNNPLDGSLRYIGLCVRVLEGYEDERVHRYLEQARQGLLRMAQIVGELLEFSRGAHAQAEDGNINWVVEEALRAMRDPADRNNVMIAVSLREKDMPAIPGSKLFQVCCNLIKNAIDAMPDGGCLTVNTLVVDEQVLIRFEDTGPGLPDNAEQLFEPFYTTKPPGEGTGLGLAICRDYIRQLGGTVIASNGEKGGAVFTIRLPLSRCVGGIGGDGGRQGRGGRDNGARER